jgi:hypothetical protein
MIGGESTQNLKSNSSIQPDIEQRKYIQEQIASYREMKY